MVGSVRAGVDDNTTFHHNLLNYRSDQMRATAVLRNSVQARKPLIHFIGKRTHSGQLSTRDSKHAVNPPIAAQKPSPHPSAPQEIKDKFSEFVAAFQKRSSGDSGTHTIASSGGGQYAEFWEAPKRYWTGLEMSEKEAEAIMVSFDA